MNEELCFSQPDPSTRWQRFIRWMLPMKLAHLPDRDSIPFPTEDVIHIDTFTSFTFLERLKILVFGTVATSVRVVTEFKSGKTHTIVATYVSTASLEKSMFQ